MITIGYNQVQEKHVADSNSSAREDAHEAKKVYVGNKLAHVHVNDNTEFALRQTLNGYIHEDNDLYAKISNIKGNTKVWNQLLASDRQDSVVLSGVNITASNGFYTLVGTAIASNLYYPVPDIELIAGHYYLMSIGNKALPLSNATNNTFYQIYGDNVINKYLKDNSPNNSIIMYISNSGIVSVRLRIQNGQTYNVTVYPMLIDLTLIYGAGNEPTTVAEFETDFQKWFGRPIGAEPYDAGSLIPFVGTGIKSTGFNQWDEELEVVGYDS